MRAVRPEVTSRLVDKCEAATGWKFRLHRFFRLMLPEACTHPECPRQEEQAQLPHRYRSDVLSSTPVPPTAAEVEDLTIFDFVTKGYRTVLARRGDAGHAEV